MAEPEPAAPTSPLLRRFGLFVATLGGVGYLPGAPGTWGTLATIPLYLLIVAADSLWVHVAVLALVIAIGIPASTIAAGALGRLDPGPVVIDETAGFLVTMLLVPTTVWTVAAGFFLFRFFDVIKPYPANRLEHLHGGLGIMADDLMAGVYAGLALHLGLWVLPL